jgi:hypothetical protein
MESGVEFDVSTLADWLGAYAVALMPMVEPILALVFASITRHPGPRNARLGPAERITQPPAPSYPIAAESAMRSKRKERIDAWSRTRVSSTFL